MTDEKVYPLEENLGKECRYWRGVDIHARKDLGSQAIIGCTYFKVEMEGRLSCEGIIDDVCLYLKDGRKPTSLTQEQISEIRHRIPLTDNRELPPGNTY